jgi:hypothetical protein
MPRRRATSPKVILPMTIQPGSVIDPKRVTFTPPSTSFNLSASITQDGGFVFQLGGQVVISNPKQERERLFDPKKKD